MQSYVGIITYRGLESLLQESEQSLRFATRRAYQNYQGHSVCCWAAMPHSAAADARRLVEDGDCDEALKILSSSAKFLGPILPSDVAAIDNG